MLLTGLGNVIPKNLFRRNPCIAKLSIPSLVEDIIMTWALLPIVQSWNITDLEAASRFGYSNLQLRSRLRYNQAHKILYMPKWSYIFLQV
jgi:hypothetical protein